MARPKKDNSEKYTERVYIRFNKNQIKEIKKYIENNTGETQDISFFLREIILKTIREEKIQFISTYSPEYLFELNKIGVNLNQISKKINSYREVREYDLPKIEEILNKISQIILNNNTQNAEQK